MQESKILIIDDNSDIISSVIRILEQANLGYMFFQAMDGLSGIKVAELHQPDIIITDWEMPGFSGIETIKRLKESGSTKHIPVIMLTGRMTSSEDLETALNAGAIDFIRKPVDEIELIARTKSMLLLASYYNDTIKLKNQELTATAINLVQNNEERIELIKSIKRIDDTFGKDNLDLSNELKTIYLEISNNIGQDAWEQFESYFKKTHPSFFSNLLSEFSFLSPSEIKMSVLVRMQLSVKDIASLMYISEDSVKTARSRLRKKLKLDRSENLTMFLLKF